MKIKSSILLITLAVSFIACDSEVKNKNEKTTTVEAVQTIKAVDALDAAVEAISKEDSEPTDKPKTLNSTVQEGDKIIMNFSNDLRPNQPISFNIKYTDTIEFVAYDDDFDYKALIGKKDGKEVSFVYNWDWMENDQYNFKVGELVKVKWKMDSIPQAGDEDVIWIREWAKDAERVLSDNKKKDSVFQKFIPKGYVLFEKKFGDLNKDGQEDCILTIKGTDRNNIVINRFDEEVDRNRRGIIVLFKNQDSYQLVAKNYECFLSENEDGGVYFPPELWLGEEKGNLIIHYGHGRYGNWRYIFRFQDSNFKLIGYDASRNHGPIILEQTSINFLTQKKLIRENTNQDSDSGGEEIFKETWYDIEIENLLDLSKIENFEELNISKY